MSDLNLKAKTIEVDENIGESFCNIGWAKFFRHKKYKPQKKFDELDFNKIKSFALQYTLHLRRKGKPQTAGRGIFVMHKYEKEQ